MRTSPYFVHPVFDFLFVGGLSIAAFLATRLSGFTAQSPEAAHVAAIAMWVVNWPHFSATLYRLFRSRENAAQYPVTAYGTPLLITAAAAGALLSPTVVAPYFIKFFLIWSPYHFSGQTVGISLIYARRNGVVIDGWWRWALSALVFGTYASSTLHAETALQGSSYYGIDYPGLGVPEWMAQGADIVMALGAFGFLAGAIQWSLTNRRLLPLMVALPSATQFTWFILGPQSQPFYVFVPFFHSLQYLPIAWAMQLGERAGETGETASKRFFARETAWWAAVNFAGGVALFWALPQLVSLFGIGLHFATGVMIAAVQIHHFFVDGVIWKLRNPKVSSPLMAKVGEWTTKEARPVRMAA